VKHFYDKKFWNRRPFFYQKVITRLSIPDLFLRSNLETKVPKSIPSEFSARECISKFSSTNEWIRNFHFDHRSNRCPSWLKTSFPTWKLFPVLDLPFHPYLAVSWVFTFLFWDFYYFLIFSFCIGHFLICVLWTPSAPHRKWFNDFSTKFTMVIVDQRKNSVHFSEVKLKIQRVV
jgi:hypothetical protein